MQILFIAPVTRGTRVASRGLRALCSAISTVAWDNIRGFEVLCTIFEVRLS